jgi:hypothetical protein
MGTEWERHGMCELAFNVAGERQGNGMGTAWERHGMCESALSDADSASSLSYTLIPALQQKKITETSIMDLQSPWHKQLVIGTCSDLWATSIAF